jgi:hypothetical protein
MITSGGKPCFFSSLRMSFAAAALFRRRCTSRSRTSPSLSTAKPELLAANHNGHLIEMPLRGRPWAPAPKFSGEQGSELQNPAPHGLVGDIQSALGEQILYVAIAQGEAKVEPHRMLDDNRRKAVASIRDCCHATILRPGPTRSSVTVTLPVQAPFHGRPHREGSPDKTGHWVLIAIRSGRCQTANPRSSVFIEAERDRASSNSR